MPLTFIFVYSLFLLSYLVYPVVVLALARSGPTRWMRPYLRIALPLGCIHLVLWAGGFSIRGDLADYFMFSADYFTLLVLVAVWPPKYTIIRVLRVMAMGAFGIMFVVGLAGIIMFLVAASDYVPRKVYRYASNAGRRYETREYEFGFVTFSDTKHTYDTYRVLGPFERRIDQTVLWELDTASKLGEHASFYRLTIAVEEQGSLRQVRFSCPACKVYVKQAR